MEENTWVLLTDGYFIKLFYFTSAELKLEVYREGDFEKSSTITYKLITRHKKNGPSESESGAPSDVESPQFVLQKISEFLVKSHEDGLFSSIVIIAPQILLDILQDCFPEQMLKLIHKKIDGDYLNLPQDQLEELLSMEFRKD